MNLDDFLTCGCFIAAPHLNKVWTLSRFTAFEENEENSFAFYKNNFFLENKKPWLKSEIHHEMTMEEFKFVILGSEFVKPNIKWNELNYENYIEQFNYLMKEINSGKLIKGVPFAHQNSQIKIKKEHILYLLKTVFDYKNKSNLFLYGLWDLNKKYGFIGGTPEILFTQNKNFIETHAIAGTISNEKINCEIHDKIVREHKIVIDGIKESLNYLGNTTIKETELLKLEKFSHLKSIIEVELKNNFNYKEILSTIHPTAALGAFPKKAGSKWLHEVEEKIEKRFNYCSPFGICVNKNYSFCIAAIRGIQWENDTLRISAGGGVIQESKLEEEWDEIRMKIKAIKNYFKI